jgi:hypothetical protein
MAVIPKLLHPLPSKLHAETFSPQYAVSIIPYARFSIYSTIPFPRHRPHRSLRRRPTRENLHEAKTTIK